MKCAFIMKSKDKCKDIPQQKKREGHNTYLIKHKEAASSQERKREYFAQLLSENLNSHW